ncbi:hypothetical protein PIB30_065397 [Stylosanthes scabra]|uniref:Uncharacterized protein n=1 Tax=Stylosanthes scabra TaxID=79078 RepID=A0ABU6UP80_9FABA|nr:hypothetical protein [Stylosanthes scabra]
MQTLPSPSTPLRRPGATASTRTSLAEDLVNKLRMTASQGENVVCRLKERGRRSFHQRQYRHEGRAASEHRRQGSIEEVMVELEKLWLPEAHWPKYLRLTKRELTRDFSKEVVLCQVENLNHI